jgi:hypothetical protein
MSKLRWSKLWWQDWSDDPALRLCSLAAQGLWMRLLCLAASAEPYGHVIVAGHAPSPRDLARIVGAHSTQVKLLLAELERNGVLSRTGDGTIYSRRLVRDYAESITKTRAGALGGNPRLMAQPQPIPPNGEDKHVVNHVAKLESGGRVQSPESERPPPPTPTPASGGRGASIKNGKDGKGHGTRTLPLLAVVGR